MILQKKLLIATNNPGKVKELHQLLVGMTGIEVVTLGELGLKVKIEESGMSFAENAGLKARANTQATGLVALADDSGLEVDALGGAPGLFSARYSEKPGATDADRRDFLLENLTGKPHPWTARFKAVIAISVPGDEIKYAEGVCEGEIITEERGTNGFGYDPIFFIPKLGRTMAELSDEEKNLVSHRGQGVRAALPTLHEIFGLD
jgi:XTP/dITP diphosphohydrolase